MDVRVGRVAAVVSLVFGGLAGCFSLGDGSQAQGCSAVCTDPGPTPANATAFKDENGCAGWACNPGFGLCEATGACGTDLLHDPHHCGACDNDCGAGPCTEGSCHPVVVLAEGLPDGTSTLAVDDAFLYVAVPGQSIQRVSRTGGTLETFASAGGGVFGDWPLAADGTGVYWMNGRQILTAKAPGQSPTVLVAKTGFAMAPLLLDTTYVYWMTAFEEEVPDGGSANGNVWRVPKAGGPAEVVAPISGAQIYARAPLATSAGFVAFADVTSLRVTRPDGVTSTVVDQSPGISALAGDDHSVYWVAGPQPKIDICIGFAGDGGCPAAPAGPEGISSIDWHGVATTTVTSSGRPSSLQASGGALWGLDHALVRVDVPGGQRTTFAGGGTISGFAIDGTHVYWVRGGKLLAGALP